MAEGKAVVHIAGEVADIGAGKAEEGRCAVDTLFIEPGVAIGGLGSFGDGDDRIVGVGEDIGRTALATAENDALRVCDRRAAARSSPVDTKNRVSHGHLRPQRYQKNTINQGVWWYRK